MRRLLLQLTGLWLFLAGYASPQLTAVPTPTLPAPTLAATALPLPTAVLLPPTPSPTAIPTAVPPTSTPTSSPILIAVPPEWETAVRHALSQSAAGRWQLTAVDDPAAQITLQTNGDGALLWQRPLALAVPFTTDWEAVTPAQAQEIMANGHPLVTILPWTDLSPTQKALRVDGRSPADPAYPLQNRLTLSAASGYETAAAELTALLQTALPADPVVHLAAVGDIMLDRALGYAISQGDLDYPFARIAPLLQAADVTVGNVESALGDVGQPQPKRYPFRAPPAAAQSLARAGFDVVSLANNHGMDYGPQALLQAIDLLRAANVAPIGAGANAAAARAPHVVEINGLRLAFLGYVHVPVEVSGFDTQSWTATDAAPGLAWGDPETISADVTAVRPQVDHVIVVLHSGYEYVDAPSPPQVAAARAAIDAGAALVLGHHAHILQGVEFYNGGVIAYGLGNFAFEIDGPPETAVLNVWLDADGVRELEFIPAIIQFGGQPRPAEPWEAAAIWQRIYRLTTGNTAVPLPSPSPSPSP